MRQPPFFNSLIVSRRRTTSVLPRVAALGLAAVLYLGLAAAVLLSQLLIVESMNPPKADFDRMPVFRQTLLPAYGHAVSATGGRPPRGGDGGGPRALARSSAPPLQAAAPRPAVVPVLPPESEVTEPAAPDPGTGYPEGEPAEVGGEGSGPGSGSGPGCAGCAGVFPGDGPGSGGTDRLDEHAPRVIPPVIIPSSRRLPQYPDLARRAGVQGTVILLIGIESDGRVGAVEVLRSPDSRYGFDLAAIEAVKQWRYKPALLDGRPVAVQASVMVEFTISR